MKQWTPVIAACILLSASILSQAAEVEPDVVIEQAWIRAMPPTQRNTAAYLSVTNRGSVALQIVGATTQLTEKAEIHVSREVEGYTRMEHLDSVPLPPGQTVKLTPGGIHVMLLDLEKMPVEGSSAPLCLVFSSGQTTCVDALVQKGSTSEGKPGHQHH